MARPMSKPEEALKEAVYGLGVAVQMATGLGNFERKVLGYYAAATYHIRYLKRFGILVLYGFQGNGRSEAMKALAAVCYSPYLFTCQDTTLAVLREHMKRSQGGNRLDWRG